jgi:DNA polymerase V
MRKEKIVLKIDTDHSIKEVFRFEAKTKLQRPLIGSRIPAGFPSPAQDYVEACLDLNEYLISHPNATFFVRVDGMSMINAGIHPDDILIVDRSLEPVHNRIVIAVVEGELTVKRLVIERGIYFLYPENPDFPIIEITENSDFTIWGVVTYVIHKA